MIIELDTKPEAFERLWYDFKKMSEPIMAGQLVPREMFTFIVLQEQFIWELKHSVKLAELKRAGLSLEDGKKERVVRSPANRGRSKLPGHSRKRHKATL